MSATTDRLDAIRTCLAHEAVPSWNDCQWLLTEVEKLRSRALVLHEALNDALNDWLGCADPVGRREQLYGLLVSESAYPLEDLATSLLCVRARPTGPSDECTGAAPRLSVSLHGPEVTISDAIKAGLATTELLDELGRSVGLKTRWHIESVQFRCDGCGMTQAERPTPDDGWGYRDGEDFCPTCWRSSHYFQEPTDD